MMMDFETFKSRTVAALEAHYGSEAKVTLHEVMKTNDIRLTGVLIQLGADAKQAIPVIYINDGYGRFLDDELSFDEYIDRILYFRKTYGNMHFDDLKGLVTDWNYARDHVYPMLISSNRNQEMLQKLVSRDYLDLSIIYVLRDDAASMPDGTSIKITKCIFDNYQISLEELHSAAMINMQHDQYAIYKLHVLIVK